MTLNQLKMANLAPRGVRGCCVPTALCFVTGECYQDIDSFLKTSWAPYKRGKGVNVNTVFGNACQIFGYKIVKQTQIKEGYERLWSLREKLPTGTYLVSNRGHMFVMKDGEFFDYNKTNINDIVYGVWEVVKA